MKRILFAAAALAIAGAAAVPASAQVWVGADPGGVGVQVGPVGAGVGPAYWGGYGRTYYHDYGPDCRIVRERVMTRSGNEIIRSHRVCY